MRIIELKIAGMTCGACVSHVTNALRGVTGVQDATIDLARETARVSGENLDLTALVAAVEEEGYDASPTVQ